jgi:hypothetical protein
VNILVITNSKVIKHNTHTTLVKLKIMWKLLWPIFMYSGQLITKTHKAKNRNQNLLNMKWVWCSVDCYIQYNSSLKNNEHLQLGLSNIDDSYIGGPRFKYWPKCWLSWGNVAFLSPSQELKGKAVLLQAWSGPEGSRKFRLPDFMTTAQDGGKVVSLTHRPPFTPR